MVFESFICLRVMRYSQMTLVILGVWLLQSCTTSVVVEGSIPTPLVSKIPARIGVYYSDEFKNYRHKESMRDAGNWDVDLGRQNIVFFRNLLDSMFVSVVEIDEPPVPAESMLALDGVLIPEVEKYGILTPLLSGLKFYSSSIEYRIVIFDKLGDKVGDWNIVGYGKSEAGLLGGADEAINEATVQAIRDGGARISIELIDQPAIQAWIETLRDVPLETSQEEMGTNTVIPLEETPGELDDA